MQPSSYKKKNIYRCDPTGWWWSIKYDGMKARWIDRKLITRSGKTIPAPTWFIELLPDTDIEGELYFGLNTFHKTATLRSRSIKSKHAWDNVTFLIFDLVDYKLSWFDRQQKLFLLELKPPLQLVTWKKVKSPKHLEKRYKQVINNGNEGVIIADPKGMYIDGYVDHVLKYKAVNDCEAIIVGYNTNENGKRLASFEVHPMVGGKPRKTITFNIGTGLKLLDRVKFWERFPIGTVIRYSYEVMGKNGKPRTPIFQGIRNDL